MAAAEEPGGSGGSGGDRPGGERSGEFSSFDYEGRIRAYARARGARREDLDDLVQEVHLKAQAFAAKLRGLGERRRGKWLLRVVRTTQIDMNRRAVLPRAEVDAGEIADPRIDGEEGERAELLAFVEGAIAELPERERQVVDLVLVGRTRKEIAIELGLSAKGAGELLGRSLSTVGRRVRAMLRG